MSSVGIAGLFITLLVAVIPIVLFIFVLMWIHQIKTNSETQVQQNRRIIELLEELKKSP